LIGGEFVFELLGTGLLSSWRALHLQSASWPIANSARPLLSIPSIIPLLLNENSAIGQKLAESHQRGTNQPDVSVVSVSPAYLRVSADRTSGCGVLSGRGTIAGLETPPVDRLTPYDLAARRGLPHSRA
jgi:hypothetical protein